MRCGQKGELIVAGTPGRVLARGCDVDCDEWNDKETAFGVDSSTLHSPTSLNLIGV